MWALLFCCALPAVLPACAYAEQPQGSYAALRQGFEIPPESAKLWCYWWWLNGNTTKDTITRDLTEMSRKGFGGVLLVDANGSNQNGNVNTPAGPTFGSGAGLVEADSPQPSGMRRPISTRQRVPRLVREFRLIIPPT